MADYNQQRHGDHASVNPEQQYASGSRWRHQESTKYAKHAGVNAPPGHNIRDANEHTDANDLANFLNQNRTDDAGPPGGAPANGNQGHVHPIIVDPSNMNVGNVQNDGAYASTQHELGDEPSTGGPKVITGQNVDHERDAYKYTPDWEGEARRAGQATDGREVRCGPLLNYRRMEENQWYGSVLMVTKGGRLNEQDQAFIPKLLLRKLGSRDPTSQLSRANAGQVAANQLVDKEGARNTGVSEIDGVLLYADTRNRFWRFTMQLEMEEMESHWDYEIPDLRFTSEGKRSNQRFWVPSVNESMRIMFHSCNGFSVGTDEKAWSGAALWNDVNRVHAEQPFHVMIGGGDQIYNDGIRVHGPLRPWTSISNPRKRRDYPFSEKLRKQCDDYYVANYIRWYSIEPFAAANGQIPQLNLWDDHDIIDGFGSYVKDFMECDVFRGIGGTAYKYYLLFQHHLSPPISTYTTDAPQTTVNDGSGVGADPEQTKDTYVLQEEEEHPCYVIGRTPGPYVAEHSRSIITRLGARIAFVGLDARTERTRHQVNYPETYQQIYDRVTSELAHAAQSNRPIQHLVVLLGIPIAYPRLTWLENILSSPLMAPIKFLNKRFGFAGGFINHFDGGVDLVDDLDDHYTAGTHKRERHELVKMLQDIAATYSVRVTILSGDVHLAAVGRFYSNAKLGISTEKDHRYMVNVVSSAIVNKPPPAAVANLLARRNKIHHLDAETDETLLKIFDKVPAKDGGASGSNKVTLPSRNWAMLTECSPNDPRNPTTQNYTGQNGTHVDNRHNNAVGGGQAHGQNLQNGEGVVPQSGVPQDGLAGAQHDDTACSRLGDGGNMTQIQHEHAASLRPHTAATGTTTQTVRKTQSSPAQRNENGIGHALDKKAGHRPLGPGEQDAGTINRAADSRQHGLAGDGALDVDIRVEQDQHNSAGHTTSYGMWIPRLDSGHREMEKVGRNWGKVFRHHHTENEKRRVAEGK